MASFLVLHGPNLNLLGMREPEIYGATTLAQVNEMLVAQANTAGHSLAHLQSNAEHELVERIHAAKEEGVDFIILNPAGYTTNSVAIRDALLGVDIPFIEVHLSNIHAREEFRKHSYFSDIAIGIISGLGHESYTLALQAAISRATNAS